MAIRHRCTDRNTKQLARLVRLGRGTAIAVLTIVGAWCGASVAHAEGDLSAAVSTARDQFKPIDEQQISGIRTDLTKSMQGLESYVKPASANGKKWLTFLQWDALKEALATDEPSFDPMVVTYQQLNRDENGLELAPFRKVADSLRKYIDALAIARQKDQADAYGKQLEALERDVKSYGEKPSGSLRTSIGRRIDFLTGLGQAPEVVDAVRTQFSQPNAFVSVFSGVLQDAVAEPISRQDPITDNILGTSIRGRGHTTGRVTLDLVPANDKAVFILRTNGRVVSQNTGHNGPAVIKSTGYTDFKAAQRVEFTDARFKSGNAAVNASTDSKIHSIAKEGGGIGGKMVSKIGWKKANETHGQVNAIASDHAETRIRSRLTDEVKDRMKKAWNRYQEEYRLPLLRRGELPTDIRFSTTQDALNYQLTQANRTQLGAPGEPPALPAGKDLIVRLHETAANNYTTAMLGGATIHEDNPNDGTKSDVTLPKWIKKAWENRMDEKADATGQPDFEPWALTFRREEPITVAFADGKVALTLHVANLKSGDDVFDKWDVTGTFTPELKDGGVTLTRDGELEVFPTGFDRDKGQLSSQQVAVRRNLTKVLTERSDQGRGFPQTIAVDKIEPTKDLDHIPPLAVETFTSGDGWLTVAWNREANGG